MNGIVGIEPLTAEAFAPFGDVIEALGKPSQVINQGMCGRYHDLARLTFTGDDARAGISVFHGNAYSLPLRLEMMERHPLGSQAFIPMSDGPFLVIVAPDMNGIPGVPLAFLPSAGQGINYHANTWHGVLTPLLSPGVFAVFDRIGPGDNLQEHWFEQPYSVDGRIDLHRGA